jgi:hypothetical protein
VRVDVVIAQLGGGVGRGASGADDQDTVAVHAEFRAGSPNRDERARNPQVHPDRIEVVS